MVVFDEVLGNALVIEHYDTFDSPMNSDLIELLDHIPPGKIIAMVISNETSGQLDETAILAIETLGSAQISNLAHRGAWALLGVKGIAPGSSVETIDNTGMAVTISASVDLLQRLRYGHLFSMTIARDPEDSLHLVVDGVPYNVPTSIVITTDEQDNLDYMMVLGKYEDITAAAMNILPDHVFAIVVNNVAGRLDSRSEETLRSLGSTDIGIMSLGNKDTGYILVGRKGREGAVEIASSSGNFEASYYTSPDYSDREAKLACPIRANSYGFHSNEEFEVISSNITVNERSALPQYTRGITVVVVKEEDCGVEKAKTFDPFTDLSASINLVNLIGEAVPGQVVAAIIHDEGYYHLSEAAMQALEGIGSALIRRVHFREAWAIIGRKGAEPGSVPEAYNTDAAALAATVLLHESECFE